MVALSFSMRVIGSVSTAAVLMLVAHFLRNHISLFRRFMMPVSLLAGLIALLFLQLCAHLNHDLSIMVKQELILGWAQAPGFLINIIFATLFLGEKIPSLKEVWVWAGPQLAYGQVVAWGNVSSMLSRLLISKSISYYIYC